MILYEDMHLLVYDKPAGVPVQSAKIGVKDCESILKTYLHEKNPGKGEPYLGMIHRLDQPVEGLLVFAKTPAAAADLSRQNAEGKMRKEYLAVRRAVDKPVENSARYLQLCGKEARFVDNPVDKWTEQVDFLRKNARENRSEIVSSKTPGAKKAVLFYQVLKSAEGLQLLEIRLKTGRHHQIRVQMAGLGTPLLGDRKYGTEKDGVDNVDNFYPALCAYHLEFIHPKTGKPMSFTRLPENPAFQTFFG